MKVESKQLSEQICLPRTLWVPMGLDSFHYTIVLILLLVLYKELPLLEAKILFQYFFWFSSWEMLGFLYKNFVNEL